MLKPGLFFLGVFAAALPASARLSNQILNFDGTTGYVLPALLSQTGLYVNVAAKPRQVTAAIVPFQVNAALWSDGSFKERFITVPAGRLIAPTDTSNYLFPDQTVMVKNFFIDTVVGDTASRILIETRFQVFRTDSTGGNWYGISYAWRRDQTDADLVDPNTGANRTLNQRASGTLVGKRWRYPSRGNCRACHTGRGTLGFITQQLNRPSLGNPGINQLQSLVAAGILTVNPLIASPSAVKWAALTDTSASLELRARSYFAANCSHCHGNGQNQGGGITHNFDFLNAGMQFMADSANPYGPGPYVNKPVGSSEFPFLIYPGHSDSSNIVLRMLSRGTFELSDADQMPPLATYQPDSAALKVVADWTCVLGGQAAGTCALPVVVVPGWATSVPPRAHGRASPRWIARWESGRLRIQGAHPVGEIQLADLAGRKIQLHRDGQGGWVALQSMKTGVYLLSSDGQSLKIFVER